MVKEASMERNEHLLSELAETMESLGKIKASAYRLYSEAVEAILSDRITVPNHIERIMDGLLDFCDEDRFIEIYRKLCRHIYYQYPQMVGEHVAIFRLQFETAEIGVDESNDTSS